MHYCLDFSTVSVTDRGSYSFLEDRDGIVAEDGSSW